ncbi:MAG TPA: hypothetical protein VEI50_14370 [Nitrospiraceae bacterium]|nr:hypothetical protein [Nitrospiraceae bacterium]
MGHTRSSFDESRHLQIHVGPPLLCVLSVGGLAQVKAVATMPRNGEIFGPRSEAAPLTERCRLTDNQIRVRTARGAITHLFQKPGVLPQV